MTRGIGVVNLLMFSVSFQKSTACHHVHGECPFVQAFHPRHPRHPRCESGSSTHRAPGHPCLVPQNLWIVHGDMMGICWGDTKFLKHPQFVHWDSNMSRYLIILTEGIGHLSCCGQLLCLHAWANTFAWNWTCPLILPNSWICTWHVNVNKNNSHVSKQTHLRRSVGP